MILSFRSRRLERFHVKGDKRGLDPQHVNRIESILELLERARAPEQLALPKYKLHKLSGDSPARWSMRVDANWRITFSFTDHDVVAVDYEDYH